MALEQTERSKCGCSAIRAGTAALCVYVRAGRKLPRIHSIIAKVQPSQTHARYFDDGGHDQGRKQGVRQRPAPARESSSW